MQDRVQQHLPYDREKNGKEQDQQRGVAQDPLGLVSLLFSQLDRDLGRGPKADQHRRGQQDQHVGKSHRDARQRVGIQCLTDKDAINEIVRALRHHADHGRQGQAEQEAGNGIFGKPAGSLGLRRWLHGRLWRG